jgi:hypothetical protein
MQPDVFSIVYEEALDLHPNHSRQFVKFLCPYLHPKDISENTFIYKEGEDENNSIYYLTHGEVSFILED